MNKKARILIVDDEESQLKAVGGFLGKIGYDVSLSSNVNAAISLLDSQPIDLVLSDMRMPGKSGLEFLKIAKDKLPDIAFILMTAYGSVSDAVEAMKSGAFNYISKPIDLDELEVGISKALENRRLLAENRRLKDLLAAGSKFEGIVSESPEMEEILNLVSRVASSSTTVLIQGESGTGKERIAKAIHYSSPRADMPLVTVNCAAVPETLLEAELFGHEKGAFTGAHAARKGKLEHADGGTLFIDEIGDMPLTTQPKLLRFLQEGTIERLGSVESRKLDIRVIAATHRDLRGMIEEKKFREDLFYRLNVINIAIPPLRERRSDIIPLAEHFIRIYSDRNSKKVYGLTRAARDAIMKYDFPGNIRELENAVESAVVLARGEAIEADDLPLAFGPGNVAADFRDDAPLPDRLEAFEKKMVFEGLKKAGGNKSEAARRLGISEKNIRDRLKKWGYRSST